jgi:hypothetical protein
MQLYIVTMIVGYFPGCTALPFRAVQIDGLVFWNHTGDLMENVTLHVEETRAFASCGLVLAGSRFSTTFPVRRYQGNQAVVSWEHRGRRWTSKPFVIQVPEGIIRGKPLKVLIVLFENGHMDARMIQ